MFNNIFYVIFTIFSSCWNNSNYIKRS